MEIIYLTLGGKSSILDFLLQMLITLSLSSPQTKEYYFGSTEVIFRLHKTARLNCNAHLFVHKYVDDWIADGAALCQNRWYDACNWGHQAWSTECRKESYNSIGHPANQVTDDGRDHHEEDVEFSFTGRSLPYFSNLVKIT